MTMHRQKLRLVPTWLALAALISMIGILPVRAQGPGDWTEHTGNPIFGEWVGGPKAYYPSVLYDPDEFSGHGTSAKYRMWYGTSSTQTALATSDDGISWTDQGVVMTDGYHATVEYYPAGYAGADSGDNPSGATMYYRMWYWDYATLYDVSAIGYTESPDGVNWFNYQPLQNGAVQIVGGGETSSGPSGQPWNRGSYGPCDVLYDPSASNTGTDWVFTMYYDGTTGGDEAIGLGFSEDGITWTGYDPDSNGKANAVLEGTYVSGDWDESYVSRATIIKNADDDYEMWYSGGVGAMDHGIGYATSSDGMNWTRDANNPILHKDDSGYPGEPWRQTRTYCPSVIKDGSTYKMWFAGKGSGYSIGYATATTAPSEVWVDPDYDDTSCTAGGHTWQYDCFDTIQDGIDAVSGSTVYVAAGTYDSSSETFPILIDKSLTLLGAQANVDPRPSQGGRSGAESIIDADETSSAVIQISASDVEVNGFTITGGTGDMVEETGGAGAADNLLFRYNILYDDLASVGDEAIQIKYSDGVVMEYNYAYDILQDGFNLSSSTNGAVRYNEAHDIYSENAAIYCYDETDIDIIGNLVYDVPNNDGIKLGDSGDGSTGGEVRDNVAHHCAEDGITIYASGVTVENNTIHDCDSENGAMYLYGADNSTVTGNQIHDNDAIGLLIHETSDVTVTHNEIYSNDDTNDTKYTGSAGLWVTDASDASTITINQNEVYDNADYGVRNDDASMLDAENNWWGDVSGPYDPNGTVEVPPCTADPASEKNADGAGNGVTDNVDYCPWTAAELWSDVAAPGWLATCEDETITVDVLLTADDFNGVEFDLDFDASALEVTDLSMGSMWPAGATNVQNVIDNTSGVVEFGAYLQQADTNISVTDGQVAQITFKELGTAGDYLLDFNDVIVSNSEGQSIPVHVEDGSLEVKGCGCVHGIVEVQGRFGPDWDGADIDVFGGPGGSYTASVGNLDGTWQICDIVEGTYDVSVEMALYLDGLKTGESVSDGTTTDVGQVKVLGGDCNDSDGVQPCGPGQEGINTLDATIVGTAFGSSPPSDPLADINDDGTVNILDASLLGGNWHKCSPVPW